MKKILVCGAGGFIGNHLVNRLVNEGNYVVGVDIKVPEYTPKSNAQKFHVLDLRNQLGVQNLFQEYQFDEIYQLAADMGGCTYIFDGLHDADVLHNSSLINLNVLDNIKKYGNKIKIFYSSSACVYNTSKQEVEENVPLRESDTYPANPDHDYGFEKLYSERLYSAYSRNYGINVRIGRYHNIYGPLGTWDGGREKAPAAVCRKVIMSTGTVDIFGTGNQTRSFLYVDECIEGTIRLMNSDCNEPLNIGSEECVTINDLTRLAASFSGKNITINNIPGPVGVNGRNSENTLIKEKLNWTPNYPLATGLKKTYDWIETQVALLNTK